MNQSFRALGVSDAVGAVLDQRGITTPFEIQALAVPEALRGGDILAKSPTGSGKTLVFALAIVERLDPSAKKPSALVLVPTRELAAQVTEEIESVGRPLGIRVASVYGGVPLKKQADLARDAHVVVATPGRLQDLVDRRMLSIASVSVLVLDEADRMLDMGFKPQVDRIVRLLPDDRQTMFFSATLDGEVGELARRYTRFPARFEGELPAEMRSGEVDHRFIPVTQDTKVQTLIELLPKDDGLTLVFVRTKAGAERLVEKLRRHDVDAVAIHGDKAQKAREKALARFDAGKVKTLVATDVAARGLDVDRITHVINFDPPEEADVYTHRIGRTGRAGRGGTGITLVLPEQQAEVSRVARLHGHAEKFEEAGMKLARPKLVYTSRRGRNSKW
ncbi:MAG: DEAD/DEAH box helicase [Actinobacteria bacterium]|nr:DEAD/DEAH box helicase [Actinomycetota bacterium]MBV8396039.1 DEAD/DEAH box helicase [Actinomycetota bacterium]MBV8597855.1 DEAD/DEAH box helicase [Actinomycetota bacterium]